MPEHDSQSEPPADDFWDKQTRDRWFFLFLGMTTLAVGFLFSSYLYVLLFAVVTATVTWPLFVRIEARVKGRRTLAAGLTMLVLFLVVFGPLTFVAWLFVREASVFFTDAARFAEEGRLDGTLQTLLADDASPFDRAHDFATQWVPAEYLPDPDRMVETVATWISTAVTTIAGAVGGALPRIVNEVVGLALDAAIFLFALFTLYLEGPRALRVVHHLSPMDDDYERKLFSVFKELANNMVIATLITAVVMGGVAGLGYAIVGLESVVFLAILSGVFSFIPLVGTAIVWIPAALYVTATYGWGWGLFVAVWNMVFTGSVDNIVKPLVLRGNTRIHPLLIFLAVFGGLGWFGVPGALVGPLIVAFFLAAYTIYAREYLGEPLHVPDDESALPKWVTRLWARVRDRFRKGSEEA